MVTEVPWATVPSIQPAEPPYVDPDALALGKTLGTFIAMAASMDNRSQQDAIGSSEVGWPCDRRVVYRMSGTAPANTINRDPLRSLIGTGVHLALAECFRRLNGEHYRFFLVEEHVTYKGVPGTADLLFRHGRVVVDWKTAKKEKITRLRREGVPRHYVVQANLYAAGLREQGEDVTHVAVVFVPIDINHDEGLDKIWVWLAPFDRAIADDAVQRLDRLAGKRPSEVAAKPDRLCPWCAHYDPNSTDLNAGCPGNSKGTGA